MKTKTILKAKRISFICLIIISVVAIIHVLIYGIIKYNQANTDAFKLTSLPWYTPVELLAVAYAFIFIILLVVFLYLG